VIATTFRAGPADELRNFEELAGVLTPAPGRVPLLAGIDIYGMAIPLSGSIGGDHTLFVNFDQRFDLERRIAQAESLGRPMIAEELAGCRERGGVLLADVAGHRITDALIAAMLHQAFLVGAAYELDRSGRITTRLFETINQRFYKSTGVSKFLTLIYGEISTAGNFRFLSAGHPPPLVFSRESGEFAFVGPDRLVTHPPIGMFPSPAGAGERSGPGRLGYKAPYSMNEIDLLGEDDVLLLYTDGLSEHAGGRFFSLALEEILAGCRGSTSEELALRIQHELLVFAEPEDDISYVVIQRTACPPPARLCG
jgi:serine phosphatase RsbU (regulator of sigma subunit)